MNAIEDIDSMKLDRSKFMADGVKYFKLFEKHIPTRMSGNVLLLSIGNLDCLDKLMSLNKDAKYTVVENSRIIKCLSKLFDSEFDIEGKENDGLDLYNIIKDLDMKFDCIIMNPPYDGNKNLYGKITLEAKKHATDVVCLSPYLNYLENSQKKDNHRVTAKLMPFLKSYELVPSTFDASFDKALCIFHFSDSTTGNVDINDIYWNSFNDPQLTKSIISKYSSYSNHCYDKIISKRDFDNYEYKVAFSGIRGHRYNGNPSWDWTTLLDEDKMKNFKKTANDKEDMYAFPFNTEKECKNFVKYVNSDIFEYMILVQKNSMNTDKWLFKKIPYLPTYTKEWSEEDIAKEFSLTKEELDYIHDEMKDFGWKTRNRK